MNIDELNDLLGKLSQSELELLQKNLQQINFSFYINKSFLKENYHPITVPKKFNSFLNMKGSAKNLEATIVFPDGSPATGYILSARSGWGDYFQIRVRSPYTGTGIRTFKVGDLINVAIMREIDRLRIILSI